MVVLALGGPAPAALAQPLPPAAGALDLARLEARLTEVTASAQRLADELERARSRDGGLRRAVEDLQGAHDLAQERLDARVRAVYIGSGPRGLDGWRQLTAPGQDALAVRGRATAVRVEQSLVDAVAGRTAAARALQAEAERFRDRLGQQAAAVLAAQDEARDLLARAQAVVERRNAAAAAEAVRTAAAGAAEAARTAAATDAAARAGQAARLAAARSTLATVSATVTRALAPAQTARGRRAAAAAEPVLRLLEATVAGYPAGYRPTGTVVSGTASWYGPGFVGSPTAGGRPYDPERPSCAHRSLPLGTVLHVRANGRSTNCLVDDRGPYAGDRVLDLSRAGSRALGYDGTAEVVAEVLTPG